jgi:hypothetical protein
MFRRRPSQFWTFAYLCVGFFLVFLSVSFLIAGYFYDVNFVLSMSLGALTGGAGLLLILKGCWDLRVLSRDKRFRYTVLGFALVFAILYWLIVLLFLILPNI